MTTEETSRHEFKLLETLLYISTKQMRIPNAGLVDLENGKYRYLTEKECFCLWGLTMRISRD